MFSLTAIITAPDGAERADRGFHTYGAAYRWARSVARADDLVSIAGLTFRASLRKRRGNLRARARCAMTRTQLDALAMRADRSEAERIAEAMARQLANAGSDLRDDRACITTLLPSWGWPLIRDHLDAAIERASAMRLAREEP